MTPPTERAAWEKLPISAMTAIEGPGRLQPGIANRLTASDIADAGELMTALESGRNLGLDSGCWRELGDILPFIVPGLISIAGARAHCTKSALAAEAREANPPRRRRAAARPPAPDADPAEEAPAPETTRMDLSLPALGVPPYFPPGHIPHGADATHPAWVRPLEGRTLAETDREWEADMAAQRRDEANDARLAAAQRDIGAGPATCDEETEPDRFLRAFHQAEKARSLAEHAVIGHRCTMIEAMRVRDQADAHMRRLLELGYAALPTEGGGA